MVFPKGVDEESGVRARLRQAHEAVAAGEPSSKKVVWLACDPETLCPGELSGFYEDMLAQGAPCWRTDCDRPLPLAFQPALDLLRPALAVAETEAPELIEEFAPEMATLFPDLAQQQSWAKILPVTAIALGGTKRRLAKDSEILYRIVYSFASVILGAVSRCASMRRAPLTLVFENADAADRLTLSCLYHLCQRIGNLPVLVIISAPEHGVAARPWLWRAADEGELPEHMRDLTDAYVVHTALFRKVVAFLNPMKISGAACIGRTSDELPEAPHEKIGTILALLGADPATVAALVPHSADKIVNRWNRRERAEIRSAIPVRDYRQLHGAIAATLLERKGSSEIWHAPLAFHLLEAGSVAKGLEASLNAANHALAFSMNFELILLCAREVLRHTEGVENGQFNAIRTAAWQLLGLTQTYLEDHDRAIAALLQALNHAPTPALQAQTCYYLGLIRAKRQKDLCGGSEWFETGLQMIEGCEAEEDLLERGWLCNGLGFIAWRAGRHDDALELVQRALALTENRNHPQIGNLRVNLINNLSLLL